MKKTILALTGIIALTAFCSAVLADNTAQQKLLNGNKRYLDDKPIHPNRTAQRRAEVAKGQHPFAAIVCCSDSRVPPEIIFDQGVGDLFIVRLAGNVVGDAALGSLEYAVKNLGVKYIMVLGHENCGAVKAALKGGKAPGHIGSLIKAIQPAIAKAKGQPGDPLKNAVKANIKLVVRQLKTSKPILEKRVKQGKLTIAGACYNLDDGKVTIQP